MFQKQCPAFLPLFWDMWGGAKYRWVPFQRSQKDSCVTEKPVI